MTEIRDEDVTPEQRRILNGLLDAFRMLGPIESLDWIAVYFENYAAAMAEHAAQAKHKHPAPWCDELVADVRALVAKYKEKARI
jgi:hypothetical protein